MGDRLLGVDGEALAGLPLSSAEALLRGDKCGKGSQVWLSVEYDVTEMWGLRSSGGPLLIEFSRPSTKMGISLVDSSQGGVIVARVEPASIAER